MVFKEPRRALVKELEARTGAGGEAWIGLDAMFEFGLQRGVLGQVLASQLLQHVGLAVLPLFEDRIEETPAEGGVGCVRFKPVDGDFGETLVERDDDRSGGECQRLGGQWRIGRIGRAGRRHLHRGR